MRLSRLRFTVRRLMIVVAAVASVLGFVTWMFREPAVIVEPAEPPRWANTDHELFNIVLADLIDDPRFNFTIDGSGPRKTRIVLHALTGGYVPRGFLDCDPWLREHGVAQEVLDDLAERNPKGKRFSLANYQPSNPNVVVAVLSRSETENWFVNRFPAACGAVVPFLPGYSRDGKTALFRFAFTTLSSGWGCYLLKKVNGRWEISGRQFYYVCEG
jgi:hypothetical protein